MNVLINSLLFSAPSVRPRCDCPEGLLPAPAGGACRNGRGRGDHQDCAARQEQRAPGECSSSGTSAFHFHAHLIDVIAVLCCPSLSTVHFRLSFPYPAPTFTAYPSPLPTAPFCASIHTRSTVVIASMSTLFNANQFCQLCLC